MLDGCERQTISRLPMFDGHESQMASRLPMFDGHESQMANRLSILDGHESQMASRLPMLDGCESQTVSRLPFSDAPEWQIEAGFERDDNRKWPLANDLQSFRDDTRKTESVRLCNAFSVNPIVVLQPRVPSRRITLSPRLLQRANCVALESVAGRRRFGGRWQAATDWQPNRQTNRQQNYERTSQRQVKAQRQGDSKTPGRRQSKQPQRQFNDLPGNDRPIRAAERPRSRSADTSKRILRRKEPPDRDSGIAEFRPTQVVQIGLA